MESDVNKPLKLNVVLACAAFLSLFRYPEQQRHAQLFTSKI